jgi:hypothetical protein
MQFVLSNQFPMRSLSFLLLEAELLEVNTLLLDLNVVKIREPNKNPVPKQAVSPWLFFALHVPPAFPLENSGFEA